MPADTLAADYWTWAEFNAAVDELCPLESARVFAGQGADSPTSYYRRKIREAVIELSHFIPDFKKNHETIYYPQDMVEDGEAHVGSFPPLSRPREAYYYSVDRQLRFGVVATVWENRFRMTTKEMWNTLDSQFTVLTSASLGALAMAETINMLKAQNRIRVGIMATSPKHDQFYIFPKLTGEWIFSLFYDGDKLDWKDDELVPFEEETAQAVAFYVQADFANYVEHDIPREDTLKKQYALKRTHLYVSLKEKGWLRQ